MKKAGISLSVLLFSLLTVMPTVTLPLEAQTDGDPKVWFSLSTLYEVYLDLDINLSAGSDLYVVFYSYLGKIEGNVTVWSGITPAHVVFVVDVLHPLGGPVEKVILLLTDNAGIVLSTLASFVVDRDDLTRRLTMLNMGWISASPTNRSAIFMEIVDIDKQWPYAPSKPDVRITVTSDLVTYEPLQNVTITANITNQWFEDITNATAKIEIGDSLDKQICAWTKKLGRIEVGETVSVQANWTAPNCTMAGFVAVASLFETAGHNRTLARGRWVFDVADDWTKVPRYGFFSTPAFSPTAKNSARKVEALKLFHVNSLQFYDWFELHGNYTPTKGQYRINGLNHLISRDRVIEIIELAQKAGMKCLPYTVIYAANPIFYVKHPDWVLKDWEGNPLMFWIWYLMNPDTPCGWHDYLIDEFLASIAMFNWDGIHLDQYGWWWTSNAYWNGSRVDMVKAFQHFINDAVGNITQTYPEGKLIFNYVTYWPECYEMMGKNTTVSALYVEVWDPYNTYSDVQYLIRQGKEYNSSKAVILAAYPSPPPTLSTILLLDAEIFANQGFHIELGEGNNTLTDPYFPDYTPLTEEMVKALRSYYECITRYEEFIYDPNVETLPISAVQVSNYPYGIAPSSNSIQVIPYARIVNGSEEARTIHFINFRGITNMEWRSQQPEPTETFGIQVEVQIPTDKLQKIEGVYLVNPDSLSSDLTSLGFNVNIPENTINFTLPSLKYWSTIVIKFSNSTGSSQIHSQYSSTGGINSKSFYVKLPIMVVFTVILITSERLSKRFRREKMILKLRICGFCHIKGHGLNTMADKFFRK